VKILYSPQKSDTSKTYYYFNMEDKSIDIFIDEGETKYCINDGCYLEKYYHKNRKKIHVMQEELLSLSDPVIKQYIIEAKNEENEIYLKLLKQYGCEEERKFEIIFPDWIEVKKSTYDYEINEKPTSLTLAGKIIFRGQEQLSEILTQTYNLSIYLRNEYNRINSNVAPIGSPISIRSLKTSILYNQILYLETLSNFVISIISEIQNEVEGFPKAINKVEGNKLKKLLEKDKYMRLEEKVQECINELSNMFLVKNSFDKTSKYWNSFKSIKRIRDSLTHIKIPELKEQKQLTLDNVTYSEVIKDIDLLNGLEMIIWYNNSIDYLFNSIGIYKILGASYLNSYSTILLLQSFCIINKKDIENEFIDNYFDQSEVIFYKMSRRLGMLK
jgi:hypothetical protein